MVKWKNYSISVAASAISDSPVKKRKQLCCSCDFVKNPE